MSFHCLVVLLMLSPSEHFAEVLNQFPISVTRPKTTTVKIRCVTQNTETIHWYQRRPNQAPRRIIYFSKNGAVLDPGIPSKFSAEKSVSSFFLVIDNIEQSDDAIYYCAYWILTVRNNHKKLITKTPRLPGTEHSRTSFQGTGCSLNLRSGFANDWCDVKLVVLSSGNERQTGYPLEHVSVSSIDWTAGLRCRLHDLMLPRRALLLNFSPNLEQR
ncbi:immunoglobulin kappa light chain-like [Rhincodon typus]|uniref:immunoglobulin kappa light chain-like n=1 Tax=Rhincodon typus TaxID=259920 RepID=UPI00202F4236|nr:immunoglobulin kappa light chain-like [Rhincodon typus]